MRRRLRSGFTASLLYTYSKSIDDDATLGGQGHVVAGSQTAAPSGGQGPNSGQDRVSPAGDRRAQRTTTQSAATTPAIAQNWLNLHAERSLSSFDQRHLLNLQAQYTTGEGLGGGTLMSGWPGRLLKEWTVVGHVPSSALGCRRRRFTWRPSPEQATPAPFGPTLPARRFPCPAEVSTSTRPLTPRLFGPMGNRGQEFDHRSQPVQPRQLCRPNIPAQRTLLPRLEGGGNQHAESSGFYRLEHDREQHAIRSSA